MSANGAAPRDLARRLAAFGDYRAMPLRERSKDALWRLYVEANRRGEAVPTTTRSKLYQWAAEDRWDEQLAAEERERLEAEKAALLADRRRQTHRFQAMLGLANETLIELMRDPEQDGSVRLRAALAVYDRAGYPAVSRTEAARRDLAEAVEDAAPPAALPPRPADDAGEDAWAAYNHALREAGR